MPELERLPVLHEREMTELPGVSANLSVPGHRSLLRLRVHPSAVRQARAALPGLLPEQVLAATSGEQYALWTAPDTWLMVSQSATVADFRQSLTIRLGEVFHAITDQSDALVVMRLQGSGAPSVLSSGCGLDFAIAAFPAGHCCSTRFAHMPLLIHKPGAAECFELYVDRSYAAALWDWLVRR